MSVLTFYDRVLTNAAVANGTGNITWTVAATQHALPPSGISVTVIYTLLDANGVAWETGRAALAESGGTYTLTRGGGQAVTDSSSSGSAISASNSSVHTLFLAADSAWEAGTIISFGISVSDETTALITGTAKTTFRMPHAMTLNEVRASVTTAPTDATLTIDINKSGATILSPKLTIDATEKTSTTATTPAVISDAALADDAEMTIDIDQIGSTIAGAGLKVWLIGIKA